MNTMIRMIAIGALALPVTADSRVAPPAASAPGPVVGEQGFGSASARVIHSVTGEPLAGMPVLVRRIVPPDDGGVRVFVTGRDGRAFLAPLEDGMYEVYVEYNGVRSRSAFFTIDGATDYHPMVTLLFNPDIDPGG